MSKPTNSAARNAMSDFERECYDWGWEAAEQRIIKLLENPLFHYTIGGKAIVLKGQPPQSTIEWVHTDRCSGCYAITLVKGEIDG